VYEVLSHKNWGASATLMNEIARDTFDYDKFAVISQLLWESMENQRPAAWRVVFKGLTLLEHLVKHGSERCVDDARNHGHALKALFKFNYYEGTVDRGVGVREKSKQIVDILGDDDRIREERQKAKKLREKFGGSRGGVQGGGGSVSSSGNYGGYGNDSWGATTGTSGGYGDGGIGAQKYSTGASRYDSDSKATRGRYDGDDKGSSNSIAQPEPTFASLPPTKSGKSKKKKATELAPSPAPEIDLFAFDDAPVVPAPSSNVGADDFAEFQSASSSGGTDPFATPALASNNFANFNVSGQSQQLNNNTAQFDAFGNIGAVMHSPMGTHSGLQQGAHYTGMMQQGLVSNNVMSAGIGVMQGNSYSTSNTNAMSGGGASTMSVRNKVNQSSGADDDDFGDFSSAGASAPAKSSDPLSKLISLDGLSKNSKKGEDKLNQPIIANAAAATFIQEKQQIAETVSQAKKGNMASFSGLDGLHNMPQLGMMSMNNASMGTNPSVMSASGADAIGSVFDPSNFQQNNAPQPKQQQVGTNPQMSNFSGMQGMQSPTMGMNYGMNMQNLTPQQQQQMIMMMMMQQNQMGGGGGNMGMPGMGGPNQQGQGGNMNFGNF
jgi:hypothetical protein